MRSRPEPSALADLQRVMASVVMRPLTTDDRMQSRWVDGGATSEIVEGFIKPNDRLTSFDRLEIYNRQYWFRLLDCLCEDYPGLRAVLGNGRFLRLATAYLVRYPSESATLRELGSRLVRFLEEEPEWTQPHQALAIEMARLEWAQVVAFDGASRPALSLKKLAGAAAEDVFFGLQPYITLLELSYPVDEVVIRVLHGEAKLRSGASNAMEVSDRPAQRSMAHRVRAERVWLIVHRRENAVFFKRVTEPEYRLLAELQAGKSLAAACESVGDLEGVTGEAVRGWFENWASLGFLVRPGVKRKS